jgi:hypothetical protein
MNIGSKSKPFILKIYIYIKAEITVTQQARMTDPDELLASLRFAGVAKFDSQLV